MSSLVKKNVLYEDWDEDDCGFGSAKTIFRFNDYFWAEDATGCQVNDCDMEKIYDAIS